jgi:GABA permease
MLLIAIEAIAGAKIIHDWYPQLEVWQIGVALMAILSVVP